jgi:hypothetical protein
VTAKPLRWMQWATESVGCLLFSIKSMDISMKHMRKMFFRWFYRVSFFSQNLRQLKLVVLLVILFGAVQACNTCGNIIVAADDVDSISYEIKQFHILFNADNFYRIYDNSSNEVKNRASKEEIENFLLYFKNELGNFEETISQSFNIIIPVDQKFQDSALRVTVECNSKFSLNQAKEIFTFDKIEGAFLISGYKIEFKNPVETPVGHLE